MSSSFKFIWIQSNVQGTQVYTASMSWVLWVNSFIHEFIIQIHLDSTKIQETEVKTTSMDWLIWINSFIHEFSLISYGNSS